MNVTVIAGLALVAAVVGWTVIGVAIYAARLGRRLARWRREYRDHD